VVWDLRLIGEPGGPSSITGTARFMTTTFYIAITLLSGHTAKSGFPSPRVSICGMRIVWESGSDPLGITAAEHSRVGQVGGGSVTFGLTRHWQTSVTRPTPGVTAPSGRPRKASLGALSRQDALAAAAIR